MKWLFGQVFLTRDETNYSCAFLAINLIVRFNSNTNLSKIVTLVFGESFKKITDVLNDEWESSQQIVLKAEIMRLLTSCYKVSE